MKFVAKRIHFLSDFFWFVVIQNFSAMAIKEGLNGVVAFTVNG